MREYCSSVIPTADTPRQKKHASSPWSSDSIPDRSCRLVQTRSAELGVRPSGRRAADGQHVIHAGVEQTLAQNPLSDHSCRAEHDDFHLKILDSRLTADLLRLTILG